MKSHGRTFAAVLVSRSFRTKDSKDCMAQHTYVARAGWVVGGTPPYHSTTSVWPGMSDDSTRRKALSVALLGYPA